MLLILPSKESLNLLLFILLFEPFIDDFDKKNLLSFILSKFNLL